MCHCPGMLTISASKFLRRLHLRFSTRKRKKTVYSQPAFTQTRLIFLRSRSLNKKTGFDTLWHDCFYIDFLHMTSLHEKKKHSVHTRGTGSWGKKQKLQEGRYFTSQPGYAHHKNGIFHYGSSRTETGPTRQIKRERSSSDLNLIKADLCHTE